MTVSTRVGPGGAFARAAQAVAYGKGDPARTRAVAPRFADTPGILEYIEKAAVSAATTVDGNGAAALAVPGSLEFLGLLRPRTALGKFGSNGVPALRRVPFAASVPVELGGGVAYWVREGSAKPLSAASFDSIKLEPLTVAAIAALTNELVEMTGSPGAESAITSTLLRANSRHLDASFLDPASAGTPGASPASITNGAPSFGSTGDPASDVAALVAATELDLEDAVLVMSPSSVLGIALQLGAAATGLSVRGGTVFGLPVVVSAGIGDAIALVHASGIAYADDNVIRIDSAASAALEMSDAPSGNVTTPTAVNVVSLFQTDSIALRTVRTINWQVAVEGAVQVVTGADYGLVTPS